MYLVYLDVEDSVDRQVTLSVITRSAAPRAFNIRMSQVRRIDLIKLYLFTNSCFETVAGSIASSRLHAVLQGDHRIRADFQLRRRGRNRAVAKTHVLCEFIVFFLNCLRRWNSFSFSCLIFSIIICKHFAKKKHQHENNVYTSISSSCQLQTSAVYAKFESACKFG